MHVIVLKYVQVLCITIFFSNNINCDKLLLHNEQEDQELYRIGACTAVCLAGSEGTIGSPDHPGFNSTPVEPKTIERCYTLCSEDRRPASALRPLVQRLEPSLHINLICRDSTNLIIEVQPRPDVRSERHSSEGLGDAAAPKGKQNQLDAFATGNVASASAGRVQSKVSGPARRKRAIGTESSSDSLSDHQKPEPSASKRANLLPEANDERSIKRGTSLTDDERWYPHPRPPGQTQGRNNPARPTGPIRQPIYLVKVQESEKEMGDRIVYMSNSSLVKIEHLVPNKRYNVTATVLTSEYEYYYVEKAQFKTLPVGYIPGAITEVKVERYETNVKDSRLVDAVISWNPAKDKTCHYEILCHADHSPDFQLKPIDVHQPEVLYTYTVNALELSANYRIAIRSKNTVNPELESQLQWHEFKTPICTIPVNGSQVCAPEAITNVRVRQEPLYDHHYQLNISWDRPQIPPDSYVVKIFDLHDSGTEDPANSLTRNLTGDAVGLFIESFEMFGPHFEVFISAYSSVGVTSESTIKTLQIGRVSTDSWLRTKLVFIILTPVLMIGLLKISISLICRRRAKLKRYEERCEYFKELEQKAPVDPSTEFEPNSKHMHDLLGSSPFPPDLITPINDELEIEVDHIILHDMLGEGAFGLVRKGFLHQKVPGEQPKPVAVKMLKECPRVEDIIEFRREMEVMKSVGTHAHIVGIVGHCTKNVRKMMLLTEYCGRGNLLNYLRLQWQRMLRLHRELAVSTQMLSQVTDSAPCAPPPELVECLTPALDNNKLPENVFNFDTSFVNDKKSLTYKNITDGTSRRPQIIENKLYPLFNEDECPAGNQTSDHQRVVTFCTNACRNVVEIVDRERHCVPETEALDGKGSVKINPCSCQRDTVVENTVDNRCYHSCPESAELQIPNTPKPVVEDDPMPGSAQLLEFSRQIALGMEYLARNKVVHRDLAARNVLVCSDNTMKIADFGLSRDIYQENLYRKTSNGKLPIKWLALESLTHQVYTSQSDVWSYGILLYEICTLGGSPYPAISTGKLLRYLENGNRMDRPKSCSEELYALMYSCWMLHPRERPTFTKIVHTLEELQKKEPTRNPPTIDLNAIVDVHCTINTTEENSYLKPVEY
ncbi:tyrosine-protein kinase receptor torso [Anopheles ziemanni]|uniref:tyrosine-protein kinase receptor torso n=1 Tax=Anopheles coustani TaxID=139045 RepID=UPI00265AE955|nr:tyrosine-protein kinase receptor torso [Anopheles coustani]XP_058121659.1 tyrosine-protein kinase receptor torso [Anopheles coustani]XP_058167087.1 tyrosine-protein kinase receptor torso [Anopheles ziemanni]